MQIKIYSDLYGWHFKLKLFNTNIDVGIYKTFKTTQTFGISNVCKNGHRVIFLDYDEHLLEHVITEIEYLQQKYKLSNFYILKSSQKPNGFHAICLDKLPYKEFITIINETSADEYYRKVPIKLDQHRWILRIIKKSTSPAPKLIKIITSKYQKREKSQPHYLYLKYQHDVKKKPKNLDDNEMLYTLEYGTLNFIDGESLKKISEKK